MNFISTFNIAFIRSVKLFFAEKKNTVLLCFCLFLSIFGISMLVFKAKEQSSLPIGIYDLDNSEISADFVKKIELNPAIKINHGSKDVLFKMLRQRKIIAFYVIEKGFEENIKKGKSEGLFSAYVPFGDEKYFLTSDIIAGELMDVLLSRMTDVFYKDYDKNDGEYLSYLEERKNDPMFCYEFDISYGGIIKNGYETASLSMIYYKLMEVFVLALTLLLLLEIIQAVTVSSASFLGIRERTVSKSAAGEMFGVFAFAFLLLIFIKLITGFIFGIVMEKEGIAGTASYLIENFFRDLLAQILFFVVFYFGRRKISSVQVYQFLGIFLIFIYGGVCIFSQMPA